MRMYPNKWRFRLHLLLIFGAVSKILALSADGDVGSKSTSRNERDRRFLNAEISESQRFLRGGYYSSGRSSYNRSGGGGGYNRGGGSGYYNPNGGYHRNSNHASGYRSGGMSTTGKVLTGLAVAGAGLALLAAVGSVGLGGAVCAGCLPLLTSLCCCCTGAGIAAGAAAAAGGYDKNSSDHRYNNMSYGCDDHGGMHDNNYNNTDGMPKNQERFERCAQQAKSETEASSARTNRTDPQPPPYSGQYAASFVDPDSGTVHNASLMLFFTPNFQIGGFTITGQGSDVDGSTIVEDGHLCPDGTAWWREKNITGDVGLQVLSRGRWNTQQRSFEGTWLANTMQTGPYAGFAALGATNPPAAGPGAVSGVVVDAAAPFAPAKPQSEGAGAAPVVAGTIVLPPANTGVAVGAPVTGYSAAPVVAGTVLGRPVV